MYKDIQNRINKFRSIIKEFDDPILVDRLVNLEFFTSPASTKYHLNYEGGLFDHSYNVMTQLVDMSNKLKLSWNRSISPYVVGMFHDICKSGQYEIIYSDGDCHHIKYKYKDEINLFSGHGDKSLMMLSSIFQLTEEESACIRYHMGAFTDKEEWEYYTSAIHTYPNVLYTHTADMISTHIIEEHN